MNLDSTSFFVSNLLHSAATAHILHFQVTGEGSDAAHRALQAYYDEVPELVDSLTESIQGAYQQILPPYRGTFMNTNLSPLDYMKAVQDMVRTERKGLPQDSEIQNEIDSIATLVNHVVYRLTFLR
jgi:DNA-binding ferritin-like protein